MLAGVRYNIRPVHIVRPAPVSLARSSIRTRATAMSEAEIVAITQRLLDAIAGGDYATYEVSHAYPDSHGASPASRLAHMLNPHLSMQPWCTLLQPGDPQVCPRLKCVCLGCV